MLFTGQTEDKLQTTDR